MSLSDDLGIREREEFRSDIENSAHRYFASGGMDGSYHWQTWQIAEQPLVDSAMIEAQRREREAEADRNEAAYQNALLLCDWHMWAINHRQYCLDRAIDKVSRAIALDDPDVQYMTTHSGYKMIPSGSGFVLLPPDLNDTIFYIELNPQQPRGE